VFFLSGYIRFIRFFFFRLAPNIFNGFRPQAAIKNSKNRDSHSWCKLHPETMKLTKRFCGVQGRFLQKEPLAAGGKK
jgi:hypothetical protein